MNSRPLSRHITKRTVKHTLKHIAFWLAVFAFYSIYFGFRDNVYGESSTFVALLLPLSCITTYIVLYWLIPGYLLTGRYARLVLYSVYLFLLSLYAEISLVVWLYVANGDFQSFMVNASIADLMDMIVGLYLVVFIAITLHLSRNWQRLKLEYDVETGALSKNITGAETSPPLPPERLKVRSDRSDRYLDIEMIAYVESLGDYVIIHSKEGDVTTKRTLTSLEKELTRFGFLRIHRSFLVQMSEVNVRTAQNIHLGDTEIPIGRSYRNRVRDYFSTSQVN